MAINDESRFIDNIKYSTKNKEIRCEKFKKILKAGLTIIIK